MIEKIVCSSAPPRPSREELHFTNLLVEHRAFFRSSVRHLVPGPVRELFRVALYPDDLRLPQVLFPEAASRS
eukprot:tig00000449_g947.t1